MIASEKARNMFSCASDVVSKQGDDIWGVLCNNLSAGIPFSSENAAVVLQEEFGWSYSTARQYARAVLQSIYDNQDGEDRAVWKPNPRLWRI
jgi:hypothetical protein